MLAFYLLLPCAFTVTPVFVVYLSQRITHPSIAPHLATVITLPTSLVIHQVVFAIRFPYPIIAI